MKEEPGESKHPHLRDRDGQAFRVLSLNGQKDYASRWKEIVDSSSEGWEQLQTHLERYRDLSSSSYEHYFEEVQQKLPPCVGLVPPVYRKQVTRDPSQLFSTISVKSTNFWALDTRHYQPELYLTPELEERYLSPGGLFADPENCPPAPPPAAIELDDDEEEDAARSLQGTKPGSSSPVAGPSRLPQAVDYDNSPPKSERRVAEDLDIEMIEADQVAEEEEGEMSEKRKGKRRAHSINRSPDGEPVASRQPSPVQFVQNIKSTVSKSVNYKIETEDARDYRNHPIKAKGANKTKRVGQTRSIKANVPRTSFKTKAPEPEPENDASEKLLYPDLFQQEPPPSRKQGATFELVDFRVVLVGNESESVDFDRLLGPGSKKGLALLGKVKIVEEMGKKDVSEELDDEEDENEDEFLGGKKLRGRKGVQTAPRKSGVQIKKGKKQPQPFVRLFGGIDFARVTITSHGYEVETRLSTFNFGYPNSRYSEGCKLEIAVDLMNLWALARWESISAPTADELMLEVGKKLEEVKREKLLNRKLQLPWQEDLPTWCRIDILRFEPGKRVIEENLVDEADDVDLLKRLLYETLPEAPFVSPEVYKMIYHYFPPRSFRTHYRDSVEEERSLELVDEEVLRSSIQDLIVKAGNHNQLKFPEEVPSKYYHPAVLNDEDLDNGQKCDVYFSAIIGGLEYRTGDNIVVVGEPDAKNLNAPWFAKIIYFLSFIDEGGIVKKQLHVEWFASADMIPSLGPYSSPRHLFRLRGRCGEIEPATVAGKISIEMLGPSDQVPRTGYYSRFIYSEIDGSFTSPPPAFDSSPSADDVPRCRKAEFRPCRACEEELETCAATLSSRRNDQPRKWVPELLQDGKSFKFYNEVYHPNDLVLLEPIDPNESPPDSDPNARTPLRLARLLSIKHGEEEGNPDAGKLGHDATVKVEWIYRREELGWYGKDERIFAREVVLSNVEEEGILARRLRGHFNLHHIDSVNSLASDPLEAHHYFNSSDSFSFWTLLRLSKPSSKVSSKLPKEDARNYKSSNRESVSKEHVEHLQCSVCRISQLAQLARAARVTRSRQALSLPGLALYAGAGFLDHGLLSGCPLMEVALAVEKNEAACEIFRNAHHAAAAQVINDSVSAISERQFLGEEDAFAAGSTFTLSGGSPCQGFSSLNRHRRVDDVRTFEPFVFIGNMSVTRPLSAIFENVARFHEHALPIPVEGTSGKGSFRQLFLSCMIELGYQLRWGVYQAAEFGVPQSRRRFIVQATLPPIPLPRSPRPTHAHKTTRFDDHSLLESSKASPLERLQPGAPHRAVTVEDLSSDLPPFEVDPKVPLPAGFDWDESTAPRYTSPPLNDFQARCRVDLQQEEFVKVTTVTQHICSAVGEEVAKRLQGLGWESKGDSGNHEDLKGKSYYPEQPPFVAKNTKLQPEWYRRLRPTEILAPLRTSMCLDSVSHGPRIHHEQARSLSLRELMRAQGASDASELFFSRLNREPTFTEVYRVIGNGVPVTLAEAFGRQLFEALVPLAIEHLESDTAISKGNVWHNIWKRNCKPLLSRPSQPLADLRISSPRSRTPSTSDESVSSPANNARLLLGHRQSTVLTTPEHSHTSFDSTITPARSRTFMESDKDDSDDDVPALPRPLQRPSVPTPRRNYCIHHTSSRLANVSSLASTPSPSTMSDSVQNRLSRTVLPSHYDTCIKTDLETLTFSGTCEILVQVSEPVEFITIHAASPLRVEGAVLASTSLKTESVRPATKIQVDEKKERLVVYFAGGEIPKGEHKIGFRFKGTLDTSMLGYYRSSYTPKGGKDGEKAYYALTQFEPCQARRAFPCFDEPDMKATHSISLISRVGTTSLSNSEVISTKHLGKGGDFERTQLLTDSFFSDSQASIENVGKTEGKTEGTTEAKIESAGEFKDDWELTKFAEVPKVSSYLVAWSNGTFESIESSYKSPLTGNVIPLMVYATYDHIEQAHLALKTKERCLPVYEKIFDIPYPLPKLDTLIAADFDAGAMENWGLITGRTSVYAYDEKKSGIAAKKRVIGVQSHEVAHMWFGNVVTMSWWDNLWLNESFATLMGEVIIIDELEPSWKIHSSFISEHLSRALDLDALRSSHPIEMPCPDEATISQIFDAVSYSKGGSVLKMLSNFV
ncbi:hypothetical protein JCM3765_002371, partial [Sporobolomyces pararoseus]